MVLALFQLQLYGLVPPFTVRFTDPVDAPLQVTLTELVVVVVAVGWVIITEFVVEQLLLSVTVTW